MIFLSRKLARRPVPTGLNQRFALLLSPLVLNDIFPAEAKPRPRRVRQLSKQHFVPTMRNSS